MHDAVDTQGSEGPAGVPDVDEAVDVVSLSSEGDGVGRLSDGRVVFVQGAVPGDRVVLDRIEPSTRFVRAAIGQLIRESPDRVAPRCRHFGVCGGCQWQHVAYSAQLEAKQRIVRDALQRIGRITLSELPGIVASPASYGYRARARWIEGEGEGGGDLGYRERSSREVHPVEECPVLVPIAEQALRETVAGLPEQARSKARRGAREWVVTADGASDEANAVVARARHRGVPPAVFLDVPGGPIRVSHGSFVQGNALLWDALSVAVREACLAPGVAPAERGPRFAELYCGVGFFTLPLAAAGASGLALESDRSALADLAYNLRRAGLEERIEVLRGRVEQRGDLARRLAGVDFVLVDPPRTGLAKPVRSALVESAPARIVYLSCDPGTLARDVADLTEAGYRLVSVRLFDLFPQTSHVETLVVLERSADEKVDPDA